MSLPIFPALVRGLTFTVTVSPEFSTDVESAQNFFEVRIPQTINPRWNFKLIYEYLKDFPWDMVSGLITTDFRTMMDFFLAMGGRLNPFLFFNPDDNQVGPAMLNGSPNTPLAQLQVVTDGQGNYYSPLQRTYGGLFYEDITDLNLTTGTEGVPLEVYADGVLQTQGTNYTLSSSPGLALPSSSFMGMYIKWIGTGVPAGPTLSQSAGGSLPATTYYVKTTYVTGGGESGPSSESSLAVSANNVLSVASPSMPSPPATGWNVYVGTTAGSEKKQNSSPIAIGTSWTEPTSGLISSGPTVPPDTSANPAGPITAQFGFYYRLRFDSDMQDFEKFINQLWSIGGDYSKNGSGMLKLTTARPVSL